MEQIPIAKRLYIGGLGHSVSEVELCERFGKFGNITETEIISRKDEYGKPTKTFAYINIIISEKDLKKCISLLNKTKWKDGTLQIEMAKESFLHRLARERQEANKKEKTNNNGGTTIQEYMKKSRVVDFLFEAVPGTEVPNYKNWVVGKFGRVLPILHLKDQHKSKIIKYDPSKYCHNLKKLDQDAIDKVPISRLTWHLEEVDDSMSKKRQGLFPEAKMPPKKKMRIQNSDKLSKVESNSANVVPEKLIQNCKSDSKKQRNQHRSDQKLKTDSVYCRRMNSLCDDDIDSEEEIRAIEAKEKKVHKGDSNIEQADSMEVVGNDFQLKYSTHWSLQKAYQHVLQACNEMMPTENEADYDSADTDEIIAVTKLTERKERNEAPVGCKATQKQKDARPKRNTSATNSKSDGSNESKPAEGKRAGSVKTPDPKVAFDRSRSKSKENSDSYIDSSESERDEDYETMMQSGYRLDLSLEDLEQLASANNKDSKENNEITQRATQDKTNHCPVNKMDTISKTSRVISTPKKCICPEDILSSILKEESCDKDNWKQKHAKVAVQPFKGLGSLTGAFSEGQLDVRQSAEAHQSSLVGLESPKYVRELRNSNSASKKLGCKPLSLKEINSESHKGSLPVTSAERSNHSTPRAGKVEKGSSEENSLSKGQCAKQLKSLSKRPTMSSLVQDKNLNSPPKSEEVFSSSSRIASKSEKLGKQLQDNEKRLAALQEKQKEREFQKITIQGALTSQQIQTTNKQKHIVFDSESENEVQENAKEESAEKVLRKEFTPKVSGRLFESSGDESDSADDENDRFKIKPQFEGKAGEKLMHLQSRYGTDERFRLDARFLESDSDQEEESKKLVIEEEEELTLEKKRNLEILKNLHLGIEPPKHKKLTADAQKFRDMNALRYDPTRQDHAVFEKKAESIEKESKTKKKKKKEAAQKLPEVSKDIFYNVAVDLKEALGSTKLEEKTEVIPPWDQHDDVEQAPSTDAPAFSAENNKLEENSGFTFSFFGTEAERSPVKEDPYILEVLKPSRIAWQEDPRFQDSSSEDEESQAAKSEDVKEMPPVAPCSNIRFFFFSQDDERLKEGPELFYKTSDLDGETEDWENRRQMLLEDCRKKHKDARRKVKAKR